MFQMTPILGALIGIVVTLIVVTVAIVLIVRAREDRDRDGDGDGDNDETADCSRETSKSASQMTAIHDAARSDRSFAGDADHVDGDAGHKNNGNPDIVRNQSGD